MLEQPTSASVLRADPNGGNVDVARRRDSSAEDGTLDEFERDWRRRFEKFGSSRDDDAGIAGWSERGLEARFRHFLRRWRLESHVGRWLDAGCGAGTYSRFLAAEGLRVVAVDYSFPSTRKARERGRAGIEWAAADVTALPLCSESVDGVLCFGVMQALSSSAHALGEIARVLRPGGQAWVDALNARCLPSAVGEWRRQRRGLRPHLRYDLPDELVAAMVASGLHDVRCYWVPIMPRVLRRLQPVVESRAMQCALTAMPWLAAISSHAFVVVGRKRDLRRG